MADEYSFVSRSALRLKVDDGIKKKKSKSKEAKKRMENMKGVSNREGKKVDKEESSGSKSESPPSKGPEEKRANLTKAQASFMKMQEKRQMERVLQKASKTHKQRVEEFNTHLDSLSEHYDIPKVSWTK